ncbi:hypothetical protein QZH41_016440 [Actinostola sp. cb2023]|nr:hypothetical protein QZH41_016440 [Actinostola sp. cb2023]
MADNKPVENTTTQQSTSLLNEKNSEHKSTTNTQEHGSNGDCKKENSTDKDAIENGIITSATSDESRCSSSDETSPVKTGFLRSFTEKKQLYRSSDYSENSQDKVEAELSQHVHQAHVEPMTVQDVFVCLWTGFKEDFVNPKTVETIKNKLPHMMPLCYEIGIDGTKIILHSKVLGKRINEKSGETDVLLHWAPDELLPDEWIPLDDYDKHKSRVVHISSLPNHIVAELDPAFYRRMSYRTHPRK